MASVWLAGALRQPAPAMSAMTPRTPMTPMTPAMPPDLTNMFDSIA
jgi:hypothetical protein